MRTLLFAALFSFLAPCWASTPAPVTTPAPAFYAVEMKILTPKGNAWGDYDALFHEGVAQAYGAPARISYSGDGQCPSDHLLCPWRGTLTNVEMAFFVDGQDAQGRPLGHFRVGVVNMPPHSSPMTREATGTLTEGNAQVELEPNGRLPGYLFEITFRPLAAPNP